MDFISPRPFDPKGGDILIRSQNWIGDVVLATASLRCIRRSFPESHISVLAKPWVIPILAYNPDIDEIIQYDGKGRHKGVTGMLRLSGYLRARRFGGAILLQRAFEAALLAFLAGIPDRMGYATDLRGFLLTHRARSSRAEFDVPRVEHDLKLLEGFGLRVDEKRLLLPIGEENMAGAEERLRELGVGRDEPVVGFSPGAVGSRLKRWYPDRFARLALRVKDAYRVRVLLFGSSDEAELGDEICRVASDPALVNLAGRTSLGEAIALVGLCGLFVTNDSGLMHVASALDVPLVGIFGPTDPRRTAPWCRRHLLVRDDEVDCSGCTMRKCNRDHLCMDRITVERAYEGVERIVALHGMEPASRRMEQLMVGERAIPVIRAEQQYEG